MDSAPAAGLKPPRSDSPIFDFLRDLHRRVSELTDGEVATYIPQLARANPDWFGICLVTANGSVYEVGDSAQLFTIQSISKPLIYGLALEDHGREDVLGKIGVEPTGDAFNSISLHPVSGRPMNPMINAGAIAATGLISGRTPEARFDRILSTLGAYAGRELDVDEAVFQSESATGHRNRAIGYMLRNFNILEEDPTNALELYFRQCAISVTCRDLAIMAATLANRGINPVTGKQAVRGEYVECILSVMGSSGMYDYAGEWIYRIGMPAKSGVAGGIIAVLPGQLGIGVFSPRLDPRGNSVRGIKVCDELSFHLDLHLFNHPRAGKSVIRSRFDGTQFSSCQVRTAEETAALKTEGWKIRGYQLQGDLAFASAETVVAEVVNDPKKPDWVILDFRWALSTNESACVIFCELAMTLHESGRSVLFTHTESLPLLRRIMRIKLAQTGEVPALTFVDNDRALEYVENELLQRLFGERSSDRCAAPDEYELFAGLNADEITVLTLKLKRRKYPRGSVIIRIGDPADALFLLARGQASALVEIEGGRKRRLAAFSPGMPFGEMAVVERTVRSATILADSPVECDVLAVEDLDELTATHPRIISTVMANLCRELSRKLRKANCERAAFEE